MLFEKQFQESVELLPGASTRILLLVEFNELTTDLGGDEDERFRGGTFK